MVREQSSALAKVTADMRENAGREKPKGRSSIPVESTELLSSIEFDQYILPSAFPLF
jgi:hypothetical protein